MKRFYILLAVLLFSQGLSLAQAKSDLEFDEFLIDKGEFPVDQPLQVYDFTFTNTGTEDLSILSTRLGCTCMTIYYPKKAVKPGKKGTVRVVYDATHQRIGHYKKYAIIHTNSDQHQGLWQVFCEGTMLKTEEYLDSLVPSDQ